MSPSIDLVIFHYHLLPGGITTVIRQGVESLVRHSRQVSRIRVVAGRVPEGLQFPPGTQIVHVPEVDYASTRSLGSAIWKERANRLASSLREQFDGGNAVWWIHNYHVGKNPLFTEAILRLASAADGPRMILQPHDFPEAGRYRNLAALDKVVGLPMYPDGPRVRYAVINTRDEKLLVDAGMDQSCLFLLENPVAPPVEGPWTGSRTGLRALLFPHANPHEPMLLYPARAIRRKNVLEAGMLLRLIDTPVRLVVTLPGISKPEKTYTSIVENAFRAGLIAGEFAAGARRSDLRLERIAAACDLMVSSSVQEGFGYVFVHALQWGLPLLARALETIPGPAELYKGYPARFYSGLACPLETPQRSALLGKYRDKVRRLEKLLSSGVAQSLEAEISDILSGESVDFSFLDASLQERLLSDSRQPELRFALKSLNRDLAANLDSLLSRRPVSREQAIEERFGLCAYAARVDALLESFSRPTPRVHSTPPRDIGERMRVAFARADQLRLLLD